MWCRPLFFLVLLLATEASSGCWLEFYDREYVEICSNLYRHCGDDFGSRRNCKENFYVRHVVRQRDWFQDPEPEAVLNRTILELQQVPGYLRWINLLFRGPELYVDTVKQIEGMVAAQVSVHRLGPHHRPELLLRLSLYSVETICASLGPEKDYLPTWSPATDWIMRSD